jgi:hypothetical protein
MDENVQVYCIYVVYTICHMQLDVMCNLSQITKEKISCMCHMQLKLVVNDNCRKQVFKKCLNPPTRSSYFNKL